MPSRISNYMPATIKQAIPESETDAKSNFKNWL